MRYFSTRGGASAKRFSEILLGGLAEDGGLVVPEHYPRIDTATLERWSLLSYPELAFEIIRLYVDDIPEADLYGLLRKTYTEEVFGSSQITPVRLLEPDLHLLQLSNGPTLAFKDIAMQWLVHAFEYVLARQGRVLNILGATSGDTGSAAEYAMRGRTGIRVFMLSPAGRMSPFQTAQMFSVCDDNIFNIAVAGVFDDCQDLVKAVSHDLNFKERCAIGTVNSINWGRVLAQVVYYFKAWFEVVGDAPRPVSFAVPSGNFGNVLAGHIAAQMGLPIRRLVVATNENDVLDEFFRTGRYRPRPGAETVLTSSPSMDISKASNFERLIWDAVDHDGPRTAALWQQIDGPEGAFDLSGTAAWERIRAWGLVSGVSSHAVRVATIRAAAKSYDVVIDPHTADGLAVAQNWREPGVPMICLETALPAKFVGTLREALGFDPVRPAAYEGLEARVQRFIRMPADLGLLKRLIAQHVA